ncbi:PE-PPE domain-containing protein [Mycobacterium sp. E787]|uniref:PE-PPE domain-containing protein n=1 Tax=Mycobacterium sp. E787 TaxID=1834150 RepID=UPI0007FE070D|nr:PE-PPE domain-containing protein [Mycobacterium sp. E787]OBI47812.1 hypothetical protein A5705_17385 [Mycobacterium sp. E787]
MTYLLAQRETMAAAAADVAKTGSVINQARATAAGRITGVAAAAGDEVSLAVGTLFNRFGLEYQAMVTQAGAFHAAFAQALAAAEGSYTQAEAAAANALTGGAGPVAAIVNAVANDPDITLVAGGSGNPIPGATYITNLVNNYVTPNFPSFTLGNAQVMYEPNGAYPIYPVNNGIKGLTFDTSVSQGVTILNNTLVATGPGLHPLLYPGSPNNVVFTGFSQSCVVASLEMEKLAAMGAAAPTASQLGFVLLGNPMTPNGGLFTRFPGFTSPSLGVTYYGATPPNTIYPTVNYTLEYDGFADFPKYPLNVLSDLNALAGIYYVHPDYYLINPQALPPGYQLLTLPTSPGYSGVTKYEMITVPNLPLLDPVRAIPVIGNPLADLLQPDLTYLVNWGYGNPAYGYPTGPADVPTPFGLFPPLGATTALGGDLISGTQQGILAAANDLSAQAAQGFPSPSSPSDLWNLASIPSLQTYNPLVALTAPQTTASNVINTLADAFSTAYATLLPTADNVTALFTALPAYDLTLISDGISQALNGQVVTGLANALVGPIAADTALSLIIGAGEGLVLLGATRSIAADLASLL